MAAELGGSQISSLLEALPGIASVLRSPVADALIKAMRAAAGLRGGGGGVGGGGDFGPDDAEELVRYAVRRGLIGADEGDRVLAEVLEALRAPRTGGRGGAGTRRKAKGKAPARKAKKKSRR